MLKVFKNFLPHLLLLVGALFLYLFSLDKVPVHLNQDELMFSLNAKAIAETGADYYGNRLPFYFWHLGSFWATPVIVYLGAIFLKFLPMTEWAIRVGSVFVAIISIGLIMPLAQRLFKNKFLTLLAGFLMATTPALFINSRLLLDNVYPIPFVLLWLVFMYRYIETKKILNLFVSGLTLGVGFHSYHAAKIIMPMYLVVTWLHGYMAKWLNGRTFAKILLGFSIPVILFVPWLQKHPDTILNQVSYISSIDKSVDASRGYLGILSPKRISDFASNYLTYFSPKILFVAGDRSLIHSTGKVGAFLFPVVFLLVFGALDILKTKDRFGKLLLLGFLTYPIAPALVNDPERISRGFIVIPFVVLLSVYGIKFMLESKEKLLKPLLYFLLTSYIILLTSFLVDYYGSYRERSYAWFNNDIGGVLESALRSTQVRGVEKIYLDEYIPFVDLYFEFYQQKLGIDANSKWQFYNFREGEFTKFSKGSLVAVRADHIATPSDKVGAFEKIETIREPNGSETFYVYYRDK